MNDLDTTWVHPGRITHVETAPRGWYRVTIDAANVRFAARNLAGRAVIRDLVILGKLENLDATDVSYVVDLECLQDYVRVGAPVMVETDADDEYVIHLHPDALQQSPDLPRVLYLVCPAEGRGRWCSNVDESVYQRPCGVRWDVLPEQDGEMDREQTIGPGAAGFGLLDYAFRDRPEQHPWVGGSPRISGWPQCWPQLQEAWSRTSSQPWAYASSAMAEYLSRREQSLSEAGGVHPAGRRL